MAYGTPRHRDEIEAYYTDIRRGRPPSPEQLADLTARYDALGGTSPLAARTEAQRTGLQEALDRLAPDQFEVLLGLKHAAPMIEETVTTIASLGVDKVVALVLAPHYSTRSIAEYVGRATRTAETHQIDVRAIFHWYDEPAYLDFLAAGVRSQLAQLPDDTMVLFTAHSIPERAIADGDPYANQLQETAELVAERVGLPSDQWQTAWQSAGRTPEPWIGPDILAVIDGLATTRRGVLVCPCGFVADHLEVLYDLDLEAADRARALGMAFGRTPSMNDDPTVLEALARKVMLAAEGTEQR